MTMQTYQIDKTEWKILVVDDDKIALEELCDTIELEGWSAVTADSVESALDLLAADESIRIVLTDVHFTEPGGQPANGIQFVSRAQARFPDRVLSYIVLSGDSNAVKSAIQVGAYNFLSKPVDPDELAAAVRAAVASGGGEREDLSEIQDQIAKVAAGKSIHRRIQVAKPTGGTL